VKHPSVGGTSAGKLARTSVATLTCGTYGVVVSVEVSVLLDVDVLDSVVDVPVKVLVCVPDVVLVLAVSVSVFVEEVAVTVVTVVQVAVVLVDVVVVRRALETVGLASTALKTPFVTVGKRVAAEASDDVPLLKDFVEFAPSSSATKSAMFAPALISATEGRAFIMAATTVSCTGSIAKMLDAELGTK